MIIFWAAIVLAVAGLLICFSILRLQQNKLNQAQRKIDEAMWVRRNKVPLLLEVLKRATVSNVSREEILGVTGKLTLAPLTLPDTLELEKTLTRMLAEIFRIHESDTKLKEESLFFVLKKELSTDLENIRIAINDYNFNLNKWKMYCRMPWFRIFEFLFEARHFHPAAKL